MKQSYIYKFIFLCNFLLGAQTTFASSINLHSSRIYNPLWDVSRLHFSNCNPIPVEVDGTTKSANLPFIQGQIANCDQGYAIEFTPSNSSILFEIFDNNVSNGYIYGSLYKIENSNSIYVQSYRLGNTVSIKELEVGATYQLVLSQNYSEMVSATSSFVMTYDLPITTFNGPYVQVNTNQYTVDELVTDVLIDNDCVQVTNITWSSGVASNPSIGYFSGNGSSFPFQDGIILSTGSAIAANGPKTTVQSFSNQQGSDTNLLNVLNQQGINGSITNTTKLEFDFVPVSDQFSFNFIFASEEYGQYQCSHSDVFAFILTNLTTGVSTNLAVVPNTTIPISVTTIKNEIYYTGWGDNCGSENPEYFANFYQLGDNTAPINFYGHTVALTALSTVIPGDNYHIKLAIADYSDSMFDSAVFIEGGSFDIGSVNLGQDLLFSENNALCFDDEYLLESGLNPELFLIQWYKDGVAIPGATGPNYLATESGTYKVVGQFIGTDCSVEDEIIIEMYPRIRDILNQPEDIEICSNSQETVDLTSVESGVLGTYPASDFTFAYYNSLGDMQNQINPIANPEAYSPSQGTNIYLEIISVESGCIDFFQFKVIIKPQPDVTTLDDVLICNNYKLPQINSDEMYYSGPNQTGTQYNPGDVFKEGTYTFYIFRNWDGCTAESSFTVQVVNCEIPAGISPNNDGLNDKLDLTYFGVLDLKIYNRYGIEVYSYGSGYIDQWKGQDKNGNDLPDGTYFYSIITLMDRFEGWIQVNR